MAEDTVSVTEGTIPFSVPEAGKECFTWYKVFGDLNGGNRPLVVLHGGPGACHNYLLSLQDLATKHAIPVLFYDQLGCGNSTHLPEKLHDTSFWTPALFLREFHNLVAHLSLTSYDVLGQSWGGMLAAEIALTQPPGLRRLIIADSPASMEKFVAGANRLKAGLPDDVRETIERYERSGEYDNPEFEAACLVFYKKHVCRLDPWPQDVVDSFAALDADKTVYLTMNGPSEFTVVGNLKTWSVEGRLSQVKNDVLLINGRYDEAVDESVMPFWEELGGRVRWYQFSEGSHMPHWEERERYAEVVAGCLR